MYHVLHILVDTHIFIFACQNLEKGAFNMSFFKFLLHCIRTKHFFCKQMYFLTPVFLFWIHLQVLHYSILPFRTISFKAPTLLSTQTNKIDYIVDQMISVMGTVAKLNNPSILRQFLLSALDYLNDQSSNDVGTPAQRKAIRDVVINSLSGLPMSTVYDIQQTASALEYLVVS